MNIINRKKRNLTSEQLEHIHKISTKLYSKSDIKNLEQDCLRKISERIGTLKTAYGYSSGKESIVILHLCKQLGIPGVIINSADPRMHYPVMRSWVKREIKKHGVHQHPRPITLEWLGQHPNQVFSRSSSDSQKWFARTHQTGLREYYKQNNLDLIILGRRKQDGNVMGRGSQSEGYTDQKNFTYYFPLASWTHAQVFAYLDHNNLKLPPRYSWTNGYLNESFYWASLKHKGPIAESWRHVFKYYPELRDILKSEGLWEKLQCPDV